MTGLILKLSYKNVSEAEVIGGICGSFFFVKSNIVATANHVLNENCFIPNEGLKYCQVWLLLEPNIVIELKRDDILTFPDVDITVVKLKEEYKTSIRAISYTEIKADKCCYNEGFIGAIMPHVVSHWATDKLVISSFNYQIFKIIGEGFVRSVNVTTVSANDIKMKDVELIKTSYGGIRGMSGGPLIDKSTDEIIGIMSIGLPADALIKENLYAVSINYLKGILSNLF